jgi:hypothetical protein
MKQQENMMSTNFYFARGRSQIEHIGKRGGGVTFMFNGQRARTYNQWVMDISTPGRGVRIVDEYGRRYSPNEMLDVIEQTKEPWGPRGIVPRTQFACVNNERNWVDEGFSFSNYEFS